MNNQRIIVLSLPIKIGKMLTTYKLHIGNETYDLRDDDLRNWDEIRCSYKRENFGGIVRSFTSQFEFVNRAKELLLAAYLKDRYMAQARISVRTVNNDWTWEQRFECPLDFSTIEWENETLKINSIDNDLSALIKANKSTKYEFKVGEDIKKDNVLIFDRLPMMENVSYEFTQGKEVLNTAELDVTFEKGQLPFVGKINDEITVNQAVYFVDDQDTDPDNPENFLIHVIKDIQVTFDYDVRWRGNHGSGGYTNLWLQVRRNGAFVEDMKKAIASPGSSGNVISEKYRVTSPQELPEASSSTMYASVSGIVWETKYNPSKGGYYWESSGKTEDEFFLVQTSGKIVLDLKANDYVVMTHELGSPSVSSAVVRFVSTKFVFNWMSRGDSVTIDMFEPHRIAHELMSKIAGANINVDVSISDFDKRIANTYIMAAESARGIPEAKFYSSFDEYCNWMETVFGYVYYIGEKEPSKYKYVRDCGRIENTPWSYQDRPYTGEPEIENIVYIKGYTSEDSSTHSRFFYRDQKNSTLYSQWKGCEDYNDPDTGHPRTDTLFRIYELGRDNLYTFGEYVGSPLSPIPYYHSEESVNNPCQTVYFVHRSELFSTDLETRVIESIRDLKYGVDSSSIYSAVTIGYDKKEYDSINGRDEFNFNNTYTTGCTVSDKTFSLLSKYRADCYGIEFAVQKRGADTTDSNSDQDVFFVLTENQSGRLVPDRSLKIENSITNHVFNGAFSPMACVRANAGIIGLQADILNLSFASSTGNSEISIDGEALSSDIIIDSPLATCGTIDFSTYETDDIPDIGSLVEVENNSMVYRGFLKEVDLKYAKAETVKYKLIVKEIEA